jgi:hypothetical protein
MAKPTLEYVIRSRDESQQGVQQAEKSVDGFTESMKGMSRSMEGVNKLAAMLMGAGAFAGITVLFGKVSAAIADCEKAFVALHPEMEKSAGSAKTFDSAVTTMKANVGATINAVLTPFRQFFIDLIDPTAAATQNLKDFTKEYDALIQKFASAGRKAQDDYNQRLADQAKTETQLADAMTKRVQLATQLADQAARLKQVQGLGAYGASAVDVVKSQIGATTGAQSANEQAIAMLQDLLNQEKQWFKDNPLNGKSGSATPLPVKVTEWNPPPGNYPSFDYLWMANGGAAARGDKNHSEPNRYAPYKGTGWEPTDPSAGQDLSLGSGVSMGGGFDLSAILGPLMQFGSQIASVNAILNPLQTIFTATLNVLAPIVNTVLQPIVGILTVLGETIGKLLVPVVEALAPVIDFIGKAFIWLYNNVIMPVGNGLFAYFTALGNSIWNLGKWIDNVVNGRWSNLKEGFKTTDLATLYAQGPLTAIDMNTLNTAGGNTIAGSAGAGASYTAQRDISVTVGSIVVNTDVITGEGGFRELVLKIDKELEQCIQLGLAN